MSFIDYLEDFNISKCKALIENFSEIDVSGTLSKGHYSISDFPVLISPAATPFIEKMAAIAKRITLLRFGKTVKLYAPLYISNECINACTYCGFNANNKIRRVTLTLDEVLKDADVLYKQGFRHILLVSGEDRKKVSVDYLSQIAKVLSKKFVGISIEVYPMDEEDYRKLAKSGVTGIAVYQETYDQRIYKELHKGPKADFNYRLATPDRAGRAGFRELGIAALLGLTDFEVDMSCVAFHASYLMKKFWKSQISVSFPRIRNAEGDFNPRVFVSDKKLAQTIFALRMVMPDVDLVMSTREEPSFRDGMAGICITRMSAGSKTQPGGYTGGESSLEQFEVADKRSPAEVSQMIESIGLEPVWKDFDRSFLFGLG